ncbi:MAG TPA: inorganic phosphate transporter, partial [Coleofasciculaceae cyanobacterium]
MLLALVSLLAFYLAWNLGANDVANSMGTAVGSRAITLKQALLIAGVLELAGALLFGPKVTATLATQIVNPALVSEHPAEFVMGMIAVVIACGIWLNIATGLRLPVSSSHAVVGAIAGFGWLAAGTEAVAWRSIGIITVSWVLTPAISGAIAALFYVILQQSILKSPDAIYRWQEAVPWISTAMFGIFGVLVFPRVAQPVQTFLADQVGWVLPEHDISILIGVIAVISFTWLSLSQLKFVGQDGTALARLAPAPAAIAPSLAVQPASPAFASPIEAQLVRFQVLSA